MESTIFSPTLKVASARRKLRRWNTNNVCPSASARGTVIAHYIVYKMIHKDTNLRLRRDKHLKIKKVFEKQDLDHIRREMKGVPDQTEEGFIPSGNDQVLNFRILHHTISDMNGAGMTYLHSLLNGLVRGAFIGKKYYDAYYFRTPVKKGTKKKVSTTTTWEDCAFHEDLEDGHDDWNFTDINDESPISIYFPLGDTPVSLDMEYTVNHRPGKPKLGRPRTNPCIQIKLDPGDILIYTTTTFRHRTSKPEPGIKVPDRVNIIMSGTRDPIDLTWDLDKEA